MREKAHGTQILVDIAIYCHFKTFRKLLFEKAINFGMEINKTITIFSRVMRRSVDFRMQEKQLLDNILGPKIYDRRIRPGGSPGGSGGNITSGTAKLF